MRDHFLDRGKVLGRAASFPDDTKTRKILKKIKKASMPSGAFLIEVLVRSIGCFPKILRRYIKVYPIYYIVSRTTFFLNKNNALIFYAEMLYFQKKF